MSDLISRKALLKEFRDRGYLPSMVENLITNAPAVSGEAVAWMYDKKQLVSDGIPTDPNGNCTCEQCCGEVEKVITDFVTTDKDETEDDSVFNVRPLYTTPQQPQSVADALEEAVKICDDYANSNFGSLVDSGQNGAYVCSKAIRALIKRNAEEGE